MKAAGFTLTEAMVTLAIFGVMLTVAAPPLTSFVEEQMASNRSNDLLSSMLLARSESVTRNALVSLCPIDPDVPGTCDSSAGWHAGWIVFEDNASGGTTGARDAGETILDTYTGMGESAVVTATNYGGAITYRPSGATTSTGTLKLCINSAVAKEIIVNATGRPRLSDSTC